MLVHCYFITIELLFFLCFATNILLTRSEPAATVIELVLSLVAVASQFLFEDERRLSTLQY